MEKRFSKGQEVTVFFLDGTFEVGTLIGYYDHYLTMNLKGVKILVPYFNVKYIKGN